MTDFIYWIGDISYTFFGFLKKLENIPNYAFIAVGFGGLLYWLNLQRKYNKKAQAEGSNK